MESVGADGSRRGGARRGSDAVRAVWFFGDPVFRSIRLGRLGRGEKNEKFRRGTGGTGLLLAGLAGNNISPGDGLCGRPGSHFL